MFHLLNSLCDKTTTVEDILFAVHVSKVVRNDLATYTKFKSKSFKYLRYPFATNKRSNYLTGNGGIWRRGVAAEFTTHRSGPDDWRIQIDCSWRGRRSWPDVVADAAVVVVVVLHFRKWFPVSAGSKIFVVFKNFHIMNRKMFSKTFHEKLTMGCMARSKNVR